MLFQPLELTRRVLLGEGPERQACTFAVSEYGDGTPYIACEPAGRRWAGWGKGSVGFVLPTGITSRAAERVPDS